ncbi:hypothetical protein LC048_20350 [Mesobacillus subterraneus]|uniref:hypothetical protein n=1 Tax=Mesobacillus subterraneus TaxID=285983 RepID=UPI001CFDF9B0|nr:hypothetical protein [Mesobacillus subterraneus]WLR54732.1 hypothetical protein LC048_20350 [Mesobacillus subterraneus]
METNMQTSQTVEIERTPEAEIKNLLNIIGVFIFAGLALTTVTNPLPAKYLKEYMLFIGGSAVTYYFLLNIYFIGDTWRKVFYASLALLGLGSLFMAVYLFINSSH